MDVMVQQVFVAGHQAAGGWVSVIRAKQGRDFRMFNQVSLHAGQSVGVDSHVRVAKDQDVTLGRLGAPIAGEGRTVG
jgi:hypothetical protein